MKKYMNPSDGSFDVSLANMMDYDLAVSEIGKECLGSIKTYSIAAFGRIKEIELIIENFIEITMQDRRRFFLVVDEDSEDDFDDEPPRPPKPEQDTGKPEGEKPEPEGGQNDV